MDELGFKLVDNETFQSALTGGSYSAQIQTLQQKGCGRGLVDLAADGHARDLQRVDLQELRPAVDRHQPDLDQLIAKAKVMTLQGTTSSPPRAPSGATSR